MTKYGEREGHQWATYRSGFRWLLLGAITAAAAVAALPILMHDAEATGPPPMYTLSVYVDGSGPADANGNTTAAGQGCAVLLSPSGGTYSPGTQVELTPSPALGWLFHHWDGFLSGSDIPAHVTMDSNKGVMAVFVHETYYTMTTAVNPAGVGFVSPNWGSYAPGSQATITANAPNGYRFNYWWGSPTFFSYDNPANVTMNNHQSVTAYFIRTYTLSTTVAPAGGGTVSPASGTYDTGAVVSLTATPAAGYRFGSWSGGATGSSNPVNVTMNADKSVTATFIKTWTLSTTVAPTGGGTVSPASGTYDNGDVVALTATPAAGYRFGSWSGGATGSSNPVNVTMNADKSVTATFIKTWTLSTTVAPTGGGTVGPASGTYDNGDVVSLTATPAAGYRFGSWSGGATGTANPVNVTMNANKSVTATFIRTYTLSTTLAPAGAGWVSPSSGTYDTGTVVTIGAEATYDYRFGSWSGDATGSTNPISVTMNANKSVTANFIKTWHLSTSVTPSNSGSLDPLSAIADDGTVVSVTATPAAGYRFGSWSGSATGSANPLNITMNAHKSVTANFIPQYVLTTSVSGEGTVNPAGGTYDPGSPVTLTATPAPGWQFKEWTGDLTGSINPRNLTMNGHKSVTAVFLPEYTLSISTWREGSVNPGVGEHVYVAGEQVVVTATGAADTHFSHWEGDVPVGQENNPNVTITMNADKELMAVFVREVALETSVIGSGSVNLNPPGGVYDQDTPVTVTATPASGWAFRGWLGDVVSSDNPLTVVMDAPVNLVAEFTEVSAAANLDLLADLGALLVATGESTADLVFDEGNGLPDAAEMMVLEAILEDAQYNRTPYGGVGHQTVYDAWSANLARAELDLPSVSAAIQRSIAAYMTLGTEGHTAWAQAAALEVSGVTLDAALYTGAPHLGALGDADGDGAWNRLEWVSVLDFYVVTTPTMTEAGIYVEWALDPTLPDPIDVSLDLADGDGTNWDYSYLPQGTVTFYSAQDLPIEIRILDPPGREDVPVTIGQPVQIPLGAELLIKLADGANADWFYTWIAPGQMIDGSAEKTERFRLMRSGTIQPERRPVGLLPLPPSNDAYTWEWSGVGPFGHMIAAGSGSAVQVQAPVGAFVKVRAYKIKEPSAGAGANVGNDKQYAKKFNYTINGGSTRRTYSSSPMFTSAAADIEPEFWVYAPDGFLTHSVSSGDGGDAFIDAGSPALIHGDMGGLYRSVTTVKPGPTDYNTYPLRVTCKTVPGKEVAGWNGGYTLAQLPNPVGIGYYTKDSGGAGGSPELANLQGLTPEVQVQGYGTPAEAGHLTADIASKYYSGLGSTKYVELNATPHPCYVFEGWSGGGVAFLDNGDDEPDIQNPVALDNEEAPVMEPRIWVARGPSEDIRDRLINGCMKFSVPTVLVTPSGDPVNAPDASGDGQNEFTFNTSIPALLEITLKAAPVVWGVPPYYMQFSIDDISDTTKEWDAANPNGRATISGGAYIATVRFFGIPPDNDTFGVERRVRLNYKGMQLGDAEFEIFFDRDANNHPQDPGTETWPNWMYYWLQTIPPSPHNVEYIPSSSTRHDVQPNRIYVGSEILSDQGYDPAYAPKRLFGIERFGWAMDHESRHLDVWRDQWSYDLALWQAACEQPGSDNDLDVDNLKTSEEDKNQNGVWDQGSERYDWQQQRTRQAPDWPSKLVDVEDYVCYEGKDAKGKRLEDWGDPGFQHLTENFND